MKKLLFVIFTACIPFVAGAQFNPGQVLTANELNAAFAQKTSNSSAAITGGTINGTRVGNVTPSTGAFTTLSTSGVATLNSLTTGNATITGGSISGLSTPLPVASGGTGAATASAARSALGLGSIATQNADNVAVTGGSATGLSSVTGQTLATKLVGYPTQAGTKWQSQYHANWNVLQSQVAYNPTEWQIYTNGANGIAQVIAGTNQVIRTYGSAFDPAWVGQPYFYWEGVGYKVASVTDADHLTVQTTGGGAVSWGSTTSGTFYYVTTSVTATVDVYGTAVTLVSGQPFIPFYNSVTINGTQYSATFNSPTSMTLGTNIGTVLGATLVQRVSIANELANLRLQGLAGGNEENFVITLAPAGTTLQHSYAGVGKYRPIWIGSGENPIGTFNPQIGIHPNSTLGNAGWLTLGGDNGNQAVWVDQNSNNVNYLQLRGNATGGTPSIATRGTDSTVGFNIDVQGANTTTFTSHSYGNTEFQVFGAGGSSWLGVGSSASALPEITANGAATDIGIKLTPKGAGQVETPAQIKSTVLTGTAPFVVASTTQVANLNASQLAGASWNAPPTIGSTTAGIGLFSALGVGNSSTSGYGLTVGGNRSSNNGIGIGSGGTLQSAVTSNYAGFSTFGLGTAAASFTLSNLRHYNATQSTFGAGSTVGSQFGFVAEATLTGATNNFGFYGDIASGSNRWNFYANGTANNAFKGNTRFGGTTAPVATVDVTGNVAVTTSILSSGATSGVGYTTGSGGTVTQATSKTTGVTLNTVTGQITMNNAALAAAATACFTLTNSAIAAPDVVNTNIASGATAGAYTLQVDAVAAGSARLCVNNRSAGSLSEAIVINYAVIKGSTN